MGNNMAQDATLLKSAKRMRHEATPFEVILWRHLSGSKLGGFKFRRQHVIEARIVDFFFPEKKLIVEVDVDTHYFELLATQSGSTGLVVGQPGDPRTYGLTVRWQL